MIRKFMPTTKAKNAYELLGDVCKAILAEPRRYYQDKWGIIGKTEIVKSGFEPPVCGTMGCVAGWCVALVSPYRFARAINAMKKDLELPYNQTVTCIATNLLMNVSDPNFSYTLYDAADDLFKGDSINKYCRDNNILTPPIGSLAYAQIGVKRIRAFMRTHRKQLKAKAL
jgi:hypothetical protein